MFRSAGQVDSDRTTAKVQQLQANWESTADTWFDGSPDSIDRRIAQCKRLAHLTRQATIRLLDRPESSHLLKAAHDLEADEQVLTAMRRDLLTAASDRHEAAVGQGLRTASTGNAKPLAPAARRWVELQARSFVADNDVDDLHELTTRAAHYAQVNTSVLSSGASRDIVAAFVDTVEGLGRKTTRRTAARQSLSFEDFPDELLY